MRKNGLHLLKPSSTAVTGAGASATISTNGSVSFTSCATLSLNGVFSSAYENYMMIWTSTGEPFNIHGRLRASGTDNTTANSYVSQDLLSRSGSLSAGRNTLDYTRFSDGGGSRRDGFVLFLYAPNLAQPTAGRSVAISDFGNAYKWDTAWTHNQSTSYDGISIIAQQNNFSGRVAVYGMRT